LTFTGYIGDGDSKTFRHVIDANPYEEDGVLVTKLECVGHVQKRVGSNLREMKKEVVCEDGKKLGGKNRLTDVVINDLQVWYGNVVRGNTDSVQKMKDAIWTSFYHVFSTDKVPEHQRCPEGADSWCKYQQAKANG